MRSSGYLRYSRALETCIRRLGMNLVESTYKGRLVLDFNLWTEDKQGRKWRYFVDEGIVYDIRSGKSFYLVKTFAEEILNCSVIEFMNTYGEKLTPPRLDSPVKTTVVDESDKVALQHRQAWSIAKSRHEVRPYFVDEYLIRKGIGVDDSLDLPILGLDEGIDQLRSLFPRKDPPSCAAPPAVVVPVVAYDGAVRALHCRAVRGPWRMTSGPVSQPGKPPGCYGQPLEAHTANTVILTEGAGDTLCAMAYARLAASVAVVGAYTVSHLKIWAEHLSRSTSADIVIIPQIDGPEGGIGLRHAADALHSANRIRPSSARFFAWGTVLSGMAGEAPETYDLADIAATYLSHGGSAQGFRELFLGAYLGHRRASQCAGILTATGA